jgi:DNA repair photolyase
MNQSNFNLNQNSKFITRSIPTSLGLDWSINPYLHPQNTFSNYNTWQNFTEMQTQASINMDAASQLENLLRKSTWTKKVLSLSGNVDCYNKLEGKLKLTRSMLKICLQHGNPVCVITRNDLILRDMDLLQQLQKNNLLQVYVQINTTKNEIKAKLEPSSTNYENRLLLIKTLLDNSIQTGVMIAPIIKNLTENCTTKIMADTQYLGVTDICTSWLKVKDADSAHFNAWMQTHFAAQLHTIL